jgi:hypothetical protein
MYIAAVSLYHLSRQVMAKRSTNLVNFALVTLILHVLISMSSTVRVSASPIYVEKVPDYVKLLGFPQVSSRLDSSGNLWVFWRDNDALYYSRADPSTWDWTTPYADYMKTIPPELGGVGLSNGSIYAVAAELAFILTIITVSSLWLRYKLGLRGSSESAPLPPRKS